MHALTTFSNECNEYRSSTVIFLGIVGFVKFKMLNLVKNSILSFQMSYFVKLTPITKTLKISSLNDIVID